MEFSAVGCNVLYEYAVGVNYNRLKIATDNVICVYMNQSPFSAHDHISWLALSETSDTELGFV